MQSLSHGSLFLFEKFLDDSSGSTYWKDKKGLYLGVNKVFVQCNEAKSENEFVGNTDMDLIWRSQAPILMKNDQEIILSKRAKTFIEPIQHSKELVYCLSHKSPLRNSKGKIIGTYGLSFILNQENSIFDALEELDSVMLPADKIKFSNMTNALSPRQIDCLYYLVKGLTMKQIGKILNLSPKTIENYLAAVKAKLGCKSRAELIAKSVQIKAIRDSL